jgi:hypothetical protein
MTYYPKSKILTNQVATQNMVGDDGLIYNYIFVSNNQYYQGYFYMLYNGKAYTGKYPGDGVNEEIIKLIDDIDAYDNPTIIVPSLTTTPIPPLFPTPKDYEVGVFTRYFIKKRNEFIFDELTKDQYSNVNTTLYIPFQIQWQLVGDSNNTYTTNRNMVLVAEQKSKVPGLSMYLKEDYLKYYK